MSKALFVISGIIGVTSIVISGMELVSNADAIERTTSRVKRFIKKKIFKQEETPPVVEIVVDEDGETETEEVADIIRDAIDTILPFANFIAGLDLLRNMNHVVYNGFRSRESALKAEIAQLKQWNLEWQSAYKAYRDAIKDLNIDCAVRVPKEVTPNV